MKNIYLYAVIAVLAFLLWLKSCKGEETSTVIKLPEVKGSFPEILKPMPEPAKEKEYIYKYLPAGKPDTVKIKVENPINKELMQFYLDSKAKDSLYAVAIGEREYNIVNEDSLLRTESKIKARGEVLSFNQEYTLKEREVALNQKKSVFRLMSGFEVGNTKEFNDFSVKGNVMFQNAKGNILLIGYDTEERFWVGYNFSIWNIQK